MSGLLPARFPGPARRTGRATLTASGSPCADADVWLLCRGFRCPRGGDARTAVAVPGYRDAGGAGEDHPVAGESPASVTEPAQIPAADAVLASQPPRDTSPRMGVDRVEGALGHSVPKTVRPPGQHPVQPQQQLIQVPSGPFIAHFPALRVAE